MKLLKFDFEEDDLKFLYELERKENEMEEQLEKFENKNIKTKEEVKLQKKLKEDFEEMCKRNRLIVYSIIARDNSDKKYS